MGMYTELIFGARLKRETPESIINSLRFLIGDSEDESYNPNLSERGAYVLQCSSYYFGVCESLQKLWRDDITGCWIVSTRSSVKNYDNDIDKFLNWIKPWIERGSGEREMYAVVMYEECSEPKIYYLEKETDL